MHDSVPVSVLILTLNEEVNIRRCIEGVAWSDDIVVLDSNSSDSTRDIARSLGAKVHTRAFDNFAGQRNFALERIEFAHDWILHLDADEVVTDELRNEIANTLVKPSHHAYRIPSKPILNGRWLKYSGMYPTYQVRLGRKDTLRFVQHGHGQREAEPGAGLGTLHHPYLHHVFSKGISDWIERHNRYSSDEAHQNISQKSSKAVGVFSFDRTTRRRALKSLSVKLPLRPMARFIYMYILRLGFLDGKAGWTYCRLMASYEWWIVLKERELRNAGVG